MSGRSSDSSSFSLVGLEDRCFLNRKSVVLDRVYFGGEDLVCVRFVDEE